MPNYFDNEKLIELVNLNLGYVSNFNERSRISLNITELKFLMNLAVSTAIGKEVAYLASHPSGNQEQAIYWPNEYENWHEHDESKGWEFLPLYTVKEIS